MRASQLIRILLHKLDCWNAGLHEGLIRLKPVGSTNLADRTVAQLRCLQHSLGAVYKGRLHSFIYRCFFGRLHGPDYADKLSLLKPYAYIYSFNANLS